MTKPPSPALSLNDVDRAFRREEFPVEVTNPEEWVAFQDLFSSLEVGQNWLGYEVAISASVPIKHAVYFMGRRCADTKSGYFNTIELTSTKGGFKMSIADGPTASRGGKVMKGAANIIDVRATSQEFLDLLYIVAKSCV